MKREYTVTNIMMISLSILALLLVVDGLVLRYAMKEEDGVSLF
jgi:hypothetical protein